MSLRVVVKVLDAQFGRMSWKMIAVKLAECGNDDGSSIYPSRETIARIAECSVVTVKRTLRVFVHSGLLIVVRQGGRGRGHATEYALNLDLLDELAKPGAPSLEARISVARDPCAKGGHHDPLNFRKGVIDDRKGGHHDPQPCKDPVLHHTRADEPADVDKLEARLRHAAGDALCRSAGRLASMATPIGWIEAGYDLDRHILPAIAAKATACKPGSVKGWAYFTGPVADWASEIDAPSIDRKPKRASNGTVEIFEGSRAWKQWRDYAWQTSDNTLKWRLQPGKGKAEVPSRFPDWKGRKAG